MEFPLHLYAVTSIIVSCSGKESYTIGRNSPRYKSDVLQLPSSMCSVSGSECKSFHKKAFSTGGTCECACPYRAATFGWYEGKWTCIDNSEVRKQSGCTYRFESEHSKTSPLKVMKEGEADSVDLTSSSCKINFSSSRYLNCDGTWDGLGLNQNSGNDFIEIKSKKRKWRTHDGTDLTYKLKIKKIKGSLAGQVVKLQIQCNGLKTSCILFNIFGEITCPVDPRQQLVSSPFPSSKPSSSSSSSSSSSGTMAAVVIVVILIIIIAAFVTFVIWKRKRGEDVWIVDGLTRFARRGHSSPKTDKQEEPAHEQIYAEIPEQPTQAGTKTSILLSGGTVELEESPPTDNDGYAEPPYAPSYHVLEDPNEQRMNDIAEKLNSDSQGQSRGGVGSDALTLAVVSGFSDAADSNRYVAKQRRQPPSPLRKGDNTKAKQNDVNGGQDKQGHGEGGNSNKNYDYESLREANRNVYQPLDRNTKSNR